MRWWSWHIHCDKHRLARLSQRQMLFYEALHKSNNKDSIPNSENVKPMWYICGMCNLQSAISFAVIRWTLTPIQWTSSFQECKEMQNLLLGWGRDRRHWWKQGELPKSSKRQEKWMSVVWYKLSSPRSLPNDDQAINRWYTVPHGIEVWCTSPWNASSGRDLNLSIEKILLG